MRTRHTTSTRMVSYHPKDGEQVYEASYKKSGSGKLKWMVGYATSSKEADKQMDTYMALNHKEYRRYGGAMLVKF